MSSNLEFDSSNKNSLISDGESLLQCFASIDMKVVLFVRASIIFFLAGFSTEHCQSPASESVCIRIVDGYSIVAAFTMGLSQAMWSS